MLKETISLTVDGEKGQDRREGRKDKRDRAGGWGGDAGIKKKKRWTRPSNAKTRQEVTKKLTNKKEMV